MKPHTENVVPDESWAIPSIARFVHVSTSTVYAWIRAGKLKASREDGALCISIGDNRNFLFAEQRVRARRPQAPYVPPEIKRYGKWHELIDEVCWLLKVSYTRTNEIRKRRFRADQLLANYIRFHAVKLGQLRRAFLPRNRLSCKMITDDLKRGWYNELAYALPLKVSTLGVSFQDVRANEPQATVRYSFPSWRITTAYYATYFYLRTLTLQKQPDIRLREHSATISSFKSNLLSPLSSVIWKFPLDIIYIPGKRRIRSGRLIRSMPHLKRRYCARPRTPHRSPVQSFERIYNVFRYGGRKMGRPTPYGLFDFLHDFRVWANYLEIDNLLNLNGSFYKSFLDQNLSLILFFIAAVTELSYIAVFGAGRYSRCLQRFHDLAVRSGSVTEEDFLRVPHHQRMQIYRELGLVKAEVTRLLPDENAVFVR